MPYEVGDVLWIIHKDRPGLIAYRVIEEITKKTLDGEIVQYLVLPASPKARSVQLETINGRIFQSKEEAKAALMENATKAIDVIVEKTQNLVDTMFFQIGNNAQSKEKNIPLKNKGISNLKDGYQWVEMEDGSKAQVKIPEIMK
jgi:hypothetical protein